MIRIRYTWWGRADIRINMETGKVRFSRRFLYLGAGYAIDRKTNRPVYVSADEAGTWEPEMIYIVGRNFRRTRYCKETSRDRRSLNLEVTPL